VRKSAALGGGGGVGGWGLYLELKSR